MSRRGERKTETRKQAKKNGKRRDRRQVDKPRDRPASMLERCWWNLAQYRIETLLVRCHAESPMFRPLPFPPDIPPRVVEIFTVSAVTVWLRRPGRRASVLVAPFSLVAVKHTHRTERREATSVRPTDQRRNREGCKRDESREEQRASTGRSSALLCRTTTESSG